MKVLSFTRTSLESGKTAKLEWGVRDIDVDHLTWSNTSGS